MDVVFLKIVRLWQLALAVILPNGVTPSLTTLEWSPYEISYQATLLMIDKLSQKDLLAQQILVAPTLVVRESTKAVT